MRPQRVAVRTDATLRTFLTPRWIGLHLLFWGAAVGMVFLGRWQLQVSNRRHFDLQNFSYVIQWWFFAAATLWFWGRTVRDRIRPPIVTTPGSGLAVQASPGGVVSYVGPADFIAPAGDGGEPPVVYRGYAMPHSAITPARSSDTYHGEYNDYLWQLSLADQAKAARRDKTVADDEPAVSAAPASVSVDASSAAQISDGKQAEHPSTDVPGSTALERS